MFPAIMMGAMAGMQLLGGIMQHNQLKAAGKAAANAGKYEQALANNRALSMDIQAGQERAVAQRQMIAERQQGNLISGRARALAAASGASLASPSVIKAMADVGMQTDYNVGVVRAQGETQAQNLEYGAQLERTSGEASRIMGKYQKKLAGQQATNALIGSVMNAGVTGGTMMQYGSPMYQKYGFGGPGV